MVYIMNIRLLFFYMNERLFSCHNNKKTNLWYISSFCGEYYKKLYAPLKFTLFLQM